MSSLALHALFTGLEGEKVPKTLVFGVTSFCSTRYLRGLGLSNLQKPRILWGLQI
jgi:hypothetical protein